MLGLYGDLGQFNKKEESVLMILMKQNKYKTTEIQNNENNQNIRISQSPVLYQKWYTLVVDN